MKLIQYTLMSNTDAYITTECYLVFSFGKYKQRKTDLIICCLQNRLGEIKTWNCINLYKHFEELHFAYSKKKVISLNT